MPVFITLTSLKIKLKAVVQNAVLRLRPNWPLNLLVLVLAILTPLVVNATFGNASDTEPSTMIMMKENQIKLYDALRRFAMPDVDYTSKVHQRFILQVPGKVLNPIDFHPGQEYEKHLSSPEGSNKSISQHAMESMFYLADVVPGPHPLEGRETGRSLSSLYKSILDNLVQLGFDDLSEEGKQQYREALDNLLEPTSDPDNSSNNVTLLQLYTRFQEMYHNERQTMEKAITEMEKLNAVEYQHWFEREYPILEAHVEAAYRRWLVLGQKHLVESYLSRLDISSARNILVASRMGLKLSGFSSQDDLFKTVYKVGFSPLNWFKHLNTSQEVPLTRHQLQAKLGNVNSRITFLEERRKRSLTEVDETTIQHVTDERTKKHESLQQKVQELEESRKGCWLVFDALCDMWSKEDEALDALAETTAADFKVGSLNWHFGENSSLKDQIDLALSKLKNESQQLQKQLLNSASSLVTPLVSDLSGADPLSLEEIQDQWKYFEFSSKKDSSSSASPDSSAPVSIASILPFDPKPPVFYGYPTFSEHVRGANIAVKAKLLKVKISRPWFRHLLFHNRELKLRRKDMSISPGYMSEGDFFDEVTRDNIDRPPHQFYQFSTALLIAKDITMDFSGLSDKAKQSALASSFGPSAQGSYGPISFGGSISGSGSYHHMQASSTASGVKVYIPGAQVIGYYCDVVPKFPNTYSFTELTS